MKTIFLMLVAVAVYAQGFGLQGPITTGGELPKYLVEYTTSEVCYECGLNPSALCSPHALDCGRQMKNVLHSQEFGALKDAITFMNRGLKHEVETFYSVTPRTFVRLLSFTEIPVAKDEQVTHEPQPAKEIRTIRYHAGDEYGEPLASLLIDGTTGNPGTVYATAPSLTVPESAVVIASGKWQASPSTSGMITLKSGNEGKPGQYLVYDQDGRPKWVDPPNPTKKPKGKKK